MKQLKIVGSALSALSFAEKVGEVAGQAAATAPAPVEPRAPRTFKIDQSKVKLGAKPTSGPNAVTVKTPPAEFHIERVEFEGNQIFKCTAVSYGVATLKEVEEKDPKNQYKPTGKMTTRLALVWAKRAIMVEDAETGKPTRLLIDIETDQGIVQYAMTGAIDFGGKPLDQVTYKEKV